MEILRRLSVDACVSCGALVVFQVDDESNRLMDVAETCCIFTITLLIHPWSRLIFNGSGAMDLDRDLPRHRPA